jgi:2-polyprenyl-3-methyl-5-hydroxy-6-metoxy-1,4-benzoquinol methylase
MTANAPKDLHWDDVYATKPTHEVSWFQEDPAISLRLIQQASQATPGGAVIDVGAGASLLVDRLLDDGHRDLTVLDVSCEALDLVAVRLGPRAEQVTRICHDLLTWHPGSQFRIWHDRAVFHFLTEREDREAYLRLVTRSVEPGGALVLGVFAEDGPTSCSGLPAARYSAADLGDVFATAFTLEHAEREEHPTPGGGVQPFTWTILRRNAG